MPSHNVHRKFTTLGRIFHSGTVNFIRNISLAVAAIAVMVVTLTILLFSLIANAAFKNTIAQITNKVAISVFLDNKTTDAQAQTLVSGLKQQAYVNKVDFLSQTQAQQRFVEDNSDNPDLSSAIAQANDDTIPRTINVYPKNLNDVPTIQKYLTQPSNKALQTARSPSYNGSRKEAIDNITHATNLLRKVGVAAVIVFTIICALIIFNTIQMAIFNRRDEITTMRLLGANTGYIRGPFVVEAGIYGVLAAVISVLIINAGFLASSNTLQASSLGLLDIGYANRYFDGHFISLLLLQIAIGIIIGTASSIIATRRYLKFKTR